MDNLSAAQSAAVMMLWAFISIVSAIAAILLLIIRSAMAFQSLLAGVRKTLNPKPNQRWWWQNSCWPRLSTMGSPMKATELTKADTHFLASIRNLLPQELCGVRAGHLYSLQFNSPAYLRYLYSSLVWLPVVSFYRIPAIKLSEPKRELQRALDYNGLYSLQAKQYSMQVKLILNSILN